jgi:hypothetical protein
MNGPIDFPDFPDNPDPGGMRGGVDNVPYIPPPRYPPRTIHAVAVAELREPHDGPTQQVPVDLGPLCGGAQIFNYVERTYFNVVRVDSVIKAFAHPIVTWAIDGQPVSNVPNTAPAQPVSNGTITVPATWDRPPGAATVPSKPTSALLATETIGPVPVNTDLPLHYGFYHDQRASLRVRMGPDAGNVIGEITVTVRERYDASTHRTFMAYLNVINQEIILDDVSSAAFMNCERTRHLADQRDQPIGPPHPGDPDHLRERVSGAIDALIAAESNLTQLAALVAEHRPELAAALTSLRSAPPRR